MFNKIKSIFHSLGPGILLAATAIGVSHLVQSVQAGAKYGTFFILIIILSHLIKYPFFAAAPKYSSVTHRSLLHGYFLLHPNYLKIYLILTIISMFTIISAVTVVAGGIMANIFQINLSIQIWSCIILLISGAILAIGKYDFLDNSMKYIIFFLLICTSLALICLFKNPVPKQPELANIFSIFDPKDFLFLIAFIGWMPCPLDCAVWNSVWITEKEHLHSEDVNYKKSLTDFRIGYITAAVLAVIFLMLGNLTFYSTSTELSPKSISFVAQFFEIYTSQLGDGAFLLIAITAFLTMFSTVITCLDAFPRVLSKTIKILFYEPKKQKYNEDKSYLKILSIEIIGTILILFTLFTNMKNLIQIATIISFLTIPFFSFFNTQLLTSSHYPKKYHLNKNQKLLHHTLTTILSIFCLIFFYTRF